MYLYITLTYNTFRSFLIHETYFEPPDSEDKNKIADDK